MKRNTGLRNIVSIVEVQYQEQQKAFGKLVAREATLRKLLDRLREDERSARLQAFDNLHLHGLGIEIAHQAWIDRQKTELNLELARVLAVKEHHLDRVKHAFGKVLAAREVLKTHEAAARKDIAKSWMENAISVSLKDRSD